jgi:hypothetical protein
MQQKVIAMRLYLTTNRDAIAQMEIQQIVVPLTWN